MNDIDLAWLAGIFDGEACFYARLTSSSRYPKGKKERCVETRIEVHVTSSRMIDEVERIFVGLGVHYFRDIPRLQRLSTRPAHKITVGRRASVRSLLEAVLPFLKVKDREAQCLIEFVSKFPDERSGERSTMDERHEMIAEVRRLKTVA